MTIAWFDNETGLFRLDELVAERPSFRKIMEDHSVTDEEVEQQANLVVERLRAVHEALPPALREQVLDLLAELAVLYAVQRHREIQQIGKEAR